MASARRQGTFVFARLRGAVVVKPRLRDDAGANTPRRGQARRRPRARVWLPIFRHILSGLDERTGAGCSILEEYPRLVGLGILLSAVVRPLTLEHTLALGV